MTEFAVNRYELSGGGNRKYVRTRKRKFPTKHSLISTTRCLSGNGTSYTVSIVINYLERSTQVPRYSRTRSVVKRVRTYLRPIHCQVVTTGQLDHGTALIATWHNFPPFVVCAVVACLVSGLVVPFAEQDEWTSENSLPAFAFSFRESCLRV